MKPIEARIYVPVPFHEAADKESRSRRRSQQIIDEMINLSEFIEEWNMLSHANENIVPIFDEVLEVLIDLTPTRNFLATQLDEFEKDDYSTEPTNLHYNKDSGIGYYYETFQDYGGDFVTDNEMYLFIHREGYVLEIGQGHILISDVYLNPQTTSLDDRSASALLCIKRYRGNYDAQTVVTIDSLKPYDSPYWDERIVSRYDLDGQQNIHWHSDKHSYFWGNDSCIVRNSHTTYPNGESFHVSKMYRAHVPENVTENPQIPPELQLQVKVDVNGTLESCVPTMIRDSFPAELVDIEVILETQETTALREFIARYPESVIFVSFQDDAEDDSMPWVYIATNENYEIIDYLYV